MLRDPLGYLSSARERWGPVVAFPVPGPGAWFVDDPAAVRRVLQGNARAYGKRTVQYDTLALVTGDGLLVADTDRWRPHRRAVQPAFHPAHLPAVVQRSVAAAQRVGQGWASRAGGVVDADAAMLRSAMEVVGATLLTTDLTSDAPALAAAVDAALHRVIARARSPWSPPTAVPTPGNRALRRAVHTLDRAVADLVAHRRRVGGPADDAVGLLLAAGLDDREVRDEVVTLVVAGHETVASALTWAWWLLATHPEAQRRLHAELDDVLGGRAPTWADWPALRWTRAVVDEALRLYPPAWVVTRRCVEPDELAGFPVAPGTTVITSPWTLHRQPGVWADPEAFDPGRWLDVRRAPQGYLPFGAGARLCIGRELALAEAVAVLAVLAQRVRVHPAGPPPRVRALVTLRPAGGLPLRLVAR